MDVHTHGPSANGSVATSSKNVKPSGQGSSSAIWMNLHPQLDVVSECASDEALLEVDAFDSDVDPLVAEELSVVASTLVDESDATAEVSLEPCFAGGAQPAVATLRSPASAVPRACKPLITAQHRTRSPWLSRCGCAPTRRG
jgi:hypothetical protein